MILNEDFFDDYDVQNDDEMLSGKEQREPEKQQKETGNWSFTITFDTDSSIFDFIEKDGQFFFRKFAAKFENFIEKRGGVFKTYDHVFVIPDGYISAADVNSLAERIKDGIDIAGEHYKAVHPYYAAYDIKLHLVFLFDMEFPNMTLEQKVKFFCDFIKDFYISQDLRTYFRVDMNQ